MIKQISVPGWENLSSEERKSVEEWVRIILSAEKASANLLKLLSHTRASAEFMANLEKIANQPDDFELVPYVREENTVTEADNFAQGTRNIDGLCDILCRILQDGKKECHEVCHGKSVL